MSLLQYDSGPETRILEVGSGSLGITRFLRRKVIAVDLAFEGPRLPWLVPCRASALHLPFADGTFVTVLAVDVLEHIPADRRRDFLSELLRVTRANLILTFPSGSRATAVEERLMRSLDRFGLTTPEWLLEHRSIGLPDVEETRRLLEDIGREQRKKLSLSHRRITNTTYWYAETLLRATPLQWLLLPLINLLPRPIQAVFLDKGPERYRAVVQVRVGCSEGQGRVFQSDLNTLFRMRTTRQIDTSAGA